MPTYNFLNVETEEYEEHFLKISELDQFKKDNSHLQSVISAPGIVSGTGSSGPKTDDGFKEVMSKIAEKAPGSPLAEKYSKKSIKEVKTREVIEKHRKIQAKKNQ